MITVYFVDHNEDQLGNICYITRVIEINCDWMIGSN